MNTETTKQTAEKGWVLFDGDCPWCVGWARRAGGALARRGFALAPLQTPWVRARLGLAEGVRPEEMAVLTAQGRVLGGADALLELARHFWWARWVRGLARLPGVLPLLHAAYRWGAARRPCANGACALPAPAVRARGWTAAEPWLALPLPVCALAATWTAEGWVMMWSVALALFASVKWLMWRTAGARPGRDGGGFLRAAGFLFAWPGMDAGAFLDAGRRVEPPLAFEWGTAGFKILLGVVLVWGAAGWAAGYSTLLAGWVGMAGLVLGLHFGLFHLLALAWRRAGVDAVPIMNAPLRAVSLAEFWGRRWNLGFSVVARRWLMQPLAGWWGPGPALFMVFLVSGLVHELVISVPARGGFGLPTAYFVLQALAMGLERARFGRWLGLGTGVRGWWFTLLVVAGPACWLFHPPFVHAVILPFLRVLGAL